MVLSLVRAVMEKTPAVRQLEDAFQSRLRTDDARTLLVDRVVETARANGFSGSLELAVAILRANHGFVVEKGPGGRWVAMRRSTALVPLATRPKSTALVPVAMNRRFVPYFSLGEIPRG